jgi:hypothetical protein
VPEPVRKHPRQGGREIYIPEAIINLTVVMS